MDPKPLNVIVFLTAFASLIITGTLIGHSSVFASQDIEQPENPPPDQNHVDVYDNPGQCIKNHKSYDKVIIDNHCKKTKND